MFQLTLLTLDNQSPKLSGAEDQWAVKPGVVVHGAQIDSPDDDYSDYGSQVEACLRKGAG